MLKKVSIIFLCLFWIGFIFYMSSNNGEISHSESKNVVKLITKIESKFQKNNQIKYMSSNQKIIDEQIAELNRLDNPIRKCAHVFIYTFLSILVSSILFSFNKRGKDVVVYILFICLFYAVLDEYHQSFVPGRGSLVSDILVDFGGAFIGVVLFYLAYYKIYEKYKAKKKGNLNNGIR